MALSIHTAKDNGTDYYFKENAERVDEENIIQTFKEQRVLNTLGKGHFKK